MHRYRQRNGGSLQINLRINLDGTPVQGDTVRDGLVNMYTNHTIGATNGVF